MYKTICIVGLSSFFCATSVFAQIERVSVSSSGDQGSGNSLSPKISANGRHVVFVSAANNLVESDTNNELDVFVHDRDTGMTERVSVSSSGDQANRSSFESSISANGRIVAFTSAARNLVVGDTNNKSDIFVHDRNTGITERVSVSSVDNQSDQHSRFPAVSADGRFVAFVSGASNLVAGDTNNVDDIFVHDRNTRITERVSVSSIDNQGNQHSRFPTVSVDGHFVTFVSGASNLVAGDTNNVDDIFVRQRNTGETERVSLSSDGDQGNRGSRYPSMNSEGRFVVFSSFARNLAIDVTNFGENIFVHDRNTGITERVSVSTSGIEGNANSESPTISADGRFVTFLSLAKNLVTSDTNDKWDAFVHDRYTGTTKRVSVSSAGDQINIASFQPSISADGRFVAFRSEASTLVAGDTNHSSDVFVTDNNLFNLTDDLSVSLRATSGAASVGEYIQFRARLTNTTDLKLSNCKSSVVNPRVNGQRELSFFSWPLNVNNPQRNGSIDIAPGETGQFILAVLPKVAMRKEVRFTYACDSTSAYNVPFINTVHLTAKTEPIIEEDYVTLANAYPKTNLVIDRGNGKYWTGYTVEVKNNGSQPASVNLSTTSDLLTVPVHLRVPLLCEPFDPTNGDWSCRTPRAEQLQVELAAGESKKIRVYVHAYRAIEKNPVRHRVVIEARDQAGKIVAKTSMGISTLN